MIEKWQKSGDKKNYLAANRKAKKLAYQAQFRSPQYKEEQNRIFKMAKKLKNERADMTSSGTVYWIK